MPYLISSAHFIWLSLEFGLIYVRISLHFSTCNNSKPSRENPRDSASSQLGHDYDKWPLNTTTRHDKEICSMFGRDNVLALPTSPSSLPTSTMLSQSLVSIIRIPHIRLKVSIKLRICLANWSKYGKNTRSHPKVGIILVTCHIWNANDPPTGDGLSIP